MDGFPSGQREQTVNLSSMTSVVRIHPRPHNQLKSLWQRIKRDQSNRNRFHGPRKIVFFRGFFMFFVWWQFEAFLLSTNSLSKLRFFDRSAIIQYRCVFNRKKQMLWPLFKGNEGKIRRPFPFEVWKSLSVRAPKAGAVWAASWAQRRWAFFLRQILGGFLEFCWFQSFFF